MAGKKRSSTDFEVTMPEGDQNFAYIAGHTSGGMPFGLTGEETEAMEASEQELQHQSPPDQAKPVPLNELIGEMQMQSEEWSVYYRRSAGEFIGIKDEYTRLIEDGVILNDRSDWEREAIAEMGEVLEHLHEPDFVALPSKYEIHEYSIMEEFCRTVKNQKIADNLSASLSGRGAFRRFKETVRHHGILENWYQFREDSLKEIGREWCRDNDLIWTE